MALATIGFGGATATVLWRARAHLHNDRQLLLAEAFVLVAATIAAPKSSLWNHTPTLLGVWAIARGGNPLAASDRWLLGVWYLGAYLQPYSDVRSDKVWAPVAGWLLGLVMSSALLMVNARSFLHITMVLFDTANEQQVRGAYETSKLLVTEAAKHGYGEYRAHLDFMDLAAEQYSFGDHAYRRFTETIKDAVDPNGILAPGKQGIWPRRLRG